MFRGREEQVFDVVFTMLLGVPKSHIGVSDLSISFLLMHILQARR